MILKYRSRSNQHKAHFAMSNGDMATAGARDQGAITAAARKKHQITESSLPLDQLNGHDLADTGSSLYKKSFTLPAIEQCPASVLHVDDKSEYQFTRELHNHRFYKPINSKA